MDAFAVIVHLVSTLEEGIHCNVLEVGVVQFYMVIKSCDRNLCAHMERGGMRQNLRVKSAV